MEKSHVFFNGYIILQESVLKRIYAGLLVFFLTLERFCFLIMVYKTKCTNYVLLLLVITLNTLLLFVGKLCRGKKVDRKMHSLFRLENV